MVLMLTYHIAKRQRYIFLDFKKGQGEEGKKETIAKLLRNNNILYLKLIMIHKP